MPLKALFLNCTLKNSPETSNTQAFIAQAEKIFRELEVETESIRIVDKNVKFGNTSDEGEGDDWPSILQRVKESDMMIIATPVWRGDRSAVAKLVAERFDGIWNEASEENGQYPTYNKVAGVLVDGNEDGAKKAISSILFDLSEHGFTVPVNAFSYYVGKAGPGPAYIKAGGDKHFFTNRTLYTMIYNMVHLSKALREKPYTSNLNELKEKAKKISDNPE